MVASMRHGTHVWLYCGQKGTDPNAISSNLPLTVLCQWNTKTVPWNSNPWNSKVEYDNRGIARVLFHGFGAIPRVLVSSVSPGTSTRPGWQTTRAGAAMVRRAWCVRRLPERIPRPWWHARAPEPALVTRPRGLSRLLAVSLLPIYFRANNTRRG